MHNGIDLVAYDGKSSLTDYIVAHTGGTVESVGYNKSAGYYANIRVSSRTIMAYYHFSQMPYVKKGATVKKGEKLGYMGSTGSATGAHLHWGIKQDGQWIDPQPYLDKDFKEEGLTVDGVWGKATTKRLQQIFGTTVDGEISNQWKMYKDKNPGLTGGWQWKDKPNGNGSQLIKAMQKWAGMASGSCDGEIGPNTIKAFQKKLGTTQDGTVSNPSQMVKALQKWANKQ
jgi:hypothetical protein